MSSLAARRVLIVAPHADDETIGACALIRRLRARAGRVMVLVMSDGSGSHRASPAWPRARLVRERRRETRRAMRRLGVTASSIRFADLPDGALDACPQLVRRALSMAIARCSPALIVGPAADDAHEDHRAVCAGLRRVGRGRAQLAYRVWPAGRQSGRSVLELPVPGGVAAKRSLLLSYRTQAGAIKDDPNGFSMSPSEVAWFCRGVERYEWL